MRQNPHVHLLAERFGICFDGAIDYRDSQAGRLAAERLIFDAAPTNLAQSPLVTTGNAAIPAYLVNFLDPVYQPRPHWIITNPPFRLGEAFTRKALELSEHGCAMLVRTSFLEGVGRYRDVFKQRPPTVVAQFTERVPMHRGKLTKRGSTATSYAWLVWVHGAPRLPLEWIPPCRKKLEMDADYFWTGEE